MTPAAAATAPQSALPRLENAPAVHLDPEPFRVALAVELDRAAPWQPGICFNPDCSRNFSPGRDWQIYCCAACRDADNAEFRAWGHRMAMAALAWRAGKYETHDKALRATSNASRRHFGHVVSAWFASRQERIKKARAAL